MDKTALLSERKQEIINKSQKIRNFIEGFLDKYSFVETDTFTFSKGDLFENSDNYGEGVVTGYACIDGIPVCLFAQNYDVCKGGLSKSQAEKILKIQKQAEKTGAVMISVIDTAGVKIGDGITALEGYAEIIAQSNKMYGVVPQISIIKGSCLGAMSYYCSMSDFVIMMDNSVAATNSPAVIAAVSSSSLSAKELCGAEVHLKKTGFANIIAKDTQDLSQKLNKLLNLLSTEEEFDTETELNNNAEALNNGYSYQAVIENIFDENSFLELNKGFALEIICGIGKIAGVTVGALLCNDNEKGVYLNSANARKSARFVRLLDRLNIPLISFVNTAGVETSVATEHTTLINDISLLISAINDFDGVKLSVICNRAIGIGYTALASKSIGFDNCIAWLNAVVSPLGEAASSVIYYEDEIKNSKDPIKAKELVEKKYAQINADPFNSAKSGSIDNIIEPSVSKQYIISMLMMLL